MQVTIKCYGAAQAATGRKAVAVVVADGATVGDALDTLADAHPEFERRRGSELVVMRDGAHVEEAGSVANGDAPSVSNPPKVED
ncbi:MoaD/ThiS family protein [Haladaptatus sp. NG-SE-30]